MFIVNLLPSLTPRVNRHPKLRERPTFSAISYTLRQPSDYLLQWPDTGSTAQTQDSLLGADSASGQDKYLTLQRMYLDQ